MLTGIGYNANTQRVCALLCVLTKDKETVMADSQNTKLIPLTQGKFAIVDEDDYEPLMLRKWQFISTGYAVSNTQISYKKGKQKIKFIFMHREILQTPNGMQTDHINGNRLDNRKCNLRICTPMQNMHNRKRDTNSTSIYKGVSWNTNDKSWRAQIGINGEKIHLGCFKSEVMAAKAYNEAAIKYHKEFALLNILQGDL